jgi:hypothetical protein
MGDCFLFASWSPAHKAKFKPCFLGRAFPMAKTRPIPKELLINDRNEGIGDFYFVFLLIHI